MTLFFLDLAIFLFSSPLPGKVLVIGSPSTESPPAERVGSGGPPEGGGGIGKASLGLSTRHQIPTPFVLVRSFLDRECICVWPLHPIQPY